MTQRRRVSSSVWGDEERFLRNIFFKRWQAEGAASFFALILSKDEGLRSCFLLYKSLVFSRRSLLVKA